MLHSQLWRRRLRWVLLGWCPSQIPQPWQAQKIEKSCRSIETVKSQAEGNIYWFTGYGVCLDSSPRPSEARKHLSNNKAGNRWCIFCQALTVWLEAFQRHDKSQRPICWRCLYRYEASGRPKLGIRAGLSSRRWKPEPSCWTAIFTAVTPPS